VFLRRFSKRLGNTLGNPGFVEFSDKKADMYSGRNRGESPRTHNSVLVLDCRWYWFVFLLLDVLPSQTL